MPLTWRHLTKAVIHRTLHNIILCLTQENINEIKAVDGIMQSIKYFGIFVHPFIWNVHHRDVA